MCIAIAQLNAGHGFVHASGQECVATADAIIAIHVTIKLMKINSIISYVCDQTIPDGHLS
jgi:hypothetical protein